MFAQLGNIVFSGLYGFNDLRFEGDQANYAEFELINSKPTLQSIGSSLMEISASVTMNVNFCDLNKQLQALKAYKDAREVLPLLLGNGKYLGDFVITGMPYSVDEAFPDGTFKQISLDLSLKEYYTINKLEQKQLSARKAAFALGDKKPVLLRNPQPLSVEKEIANTITSSRQQAAKIDDQVAEMEKNPTRITADKILNAAQKGRVSLTTLKDKLENNLEILTDNPSLKTIADVMLSNFNGIITAYPFSTIAGTITKNTALQENSRSLSRASTALLKKIIIRK
jgi:phage protein U